MDNNFTIETMKRVLEYEKEKLENATNQIVYYKERLNKLKDLEKELEKNIKDLENNLSKLVE